MENISDELVNHGFEYDSSWITRAMKEDETVATILCGHSERLAIAWNFVEHPQTKIIQITKNLRICGDCRKYDSDSSVTIVLLMNLFVDGATKLIAKIRQCEIIVRDPNRIHHFQKNGQCSCNDYF